MQSHNHSDERSNRDLQVNQRCVPGQAAMNEETERLIIRDITQADVPAYMHLVEECPEAFPEDIIGLSQEEFRERHEAYITWQYGFYGFGMWGLFNKKDGTMIGAAGIDSDGCLGYAVSAPYRRQGFAFEACSFILKYAAEELGFDRIDVKISASNTASAALARKLGLEPQLIP